MTQSEMGLLMHLIYNPEPEMAICQNPTFCEVFMADGDELFCAECEENLSALEKWNIRYAIDNNIAPESVLRHIMNGGE